MANASLNRLAFDIDTPVFTAEPIRLRERSVTLAIRYARAGGTPFLAGQPGSARGAGAVEGVVYIDANRDGVRQAGERLVAGVVLVLDGVMTATSGTNGRFEFPIVRQGRHVLRVDPSTVRLPYGLRDDAPWRFEVPVRAVHRLEVPLVRTDE